MGRGVGGLCMTLVVIDREVRTGRRVEDCDRYWSGRMMVGSILTCLLVGVDDDGDDTALFPCVAACV